MLVSLDLDRWIDRYFIRPVREIGGRRTDLKKNQYGQTRLNLPIGVRICFEHITTVIHSHLARDPTFGVKT